MTSEEAWKGWRYDLNELADLLSVPRLVVLSWVEAGRLTPDPPRPGESSPAFNASTIARIFERGLDAELGDGSRELPPEAAPRVRHRPRRRDR